MSRSGFIVSFAVAARYASSLVVLSMVSQSKISVGTRDFACFALHSRTPRPDPPPPTGAVVIQSGESTSTRFFLITIRRGVAGRSSQPISVLLARLSPLITLLPTLLLLTTPLSASAVYTTRRESKISLIHFKHSCYNYKPSTVVQHCRQSKHLHSNVMS